MVEQKLDLRESYSTPEYCAQYRESNRDFVQHLVENEGIFFYLEHTSDKHVMVRWTCPRHARRFQGPADCRFDSRRQVAEEEHVFSFIRTRRDVPNTFAFKDCYFETTTLALLMRILAKFRPS